MSHINDSISNKCHHEYIEQCADGEELERIYEQLTREPSESSSYLRQVTRDRLQRYRPDSLLLRTIESFLGETTKKKIDNGTTDSDHQKTESKDLRNTLDTLDNDSNHVSDDPVFDEENGIPGDSDQSVDDLQQQGNVAFERGDYNDAIRLFSEGLEIDGTNLNVYMDRALAYFKANNIKAAKADCSYIISVDPCQKQASDLLQQCLAGETPDDDLDQHSTNPFSRSMPKIIEDDDHYPYSSPDSPNGIAITPPAMDVDEVNDPDGDQGHRLAKLAETSHIRNDIEMDTIPDNWETRATEANKVFFGKLDGEPMVSFNSQSYNRTTRTNMHAFDEADSEPSSPIATESTVQQRIYEKITESKFSSLIQSWLRDCVPGSSASRYSSYLDLPWSNSPAPYAIHTMENDIYRHQRYDDHDEVIKIAKLTLKNGTLDYHRHSESIVTTLYACVEAYDKMNMYEKVIEYASEALEYNRLHSDILFERAKAFHHEDCLLFSYADCQKVIKTDYRNYQARTLSDDLEEQLRLNYGDDWYEHVPTGDMDISFEYVRLKYSSNHALDFDQYMELADRTFDDACYIQAIKFYSAAIALVPENVKAYAKRAACYIKVYEPKKALTDCNRVLEVEQNNFEALYIKARAYKIQHEDYDYGYTLQECLRLQPTNAVLLTEFHSIRHRHIPREQRRLRPPNHTDVKSDTIVNPLTWRELEQMHDHAYSYDSYALSDELQTIQLDDIRSQCSFVLSLPEKTLSKVLGTVSKKLMEVVINASKAMIELEKSSPGNVYFSYTNFCLCILAQLARLPSTQSAVVTLDDYYRQSLNDLIELFSSLPDYCDVKDSLEQLKQ